VDRSEHHLSQCACRLTAVARAVGDLLDKIICKSASLEITGEPDDQVTDRPGHDRRYAIDCSKIEREFGFCPRVRLEAGLRATIAWYLAKPHVLATGWQRTQSEP